MKFLGFEASFLMNSELRKYIRKSILSFIKGQTKSKYFFQTDVSSKKQTKQIQLYYYDTSGWLVFDNFLEETEDSRKMFRN